MYLCSSPLTKPIIFFFFSKSIFSLLASFAPRYSGLLPTSLFLHFKFDRFISYLKLLSIKILQVLLVIHCLFYLPILHLVILYLRSLIHESQMIFPLSCTSHTALSLTILFSHLIFITTCDWCCYDFLITDKQTEMWGSWVMSSRPHRKVME